MNLFTRGPSESQCQGDDTLNRYYQLYGFYVKLVDNISVFPCDVKTRMPD